MKLFSRKKFKIQLRTYFTLVILCTLGGVYVFSRVLVYTLSNLTQISPAVLETISSVILTVIVGGILALVLSKTILEPIIQLNREMRKVADGDFSPNVESGSNIAEIQEVYESFGQMVKDLAATEMLQTDFISNVSHEFKTPINGIEGYAMLLQDVPMASGEQAEYVEKILLNTRRLSGLTSDILLLAKLDNQTFPIQTEVYRLDEQIRQAIVFLEQKWVDKQILLDVDMEEVNYRGSESLLFHAWTNLIDNAIKFNHVGGSVIIRLQESQGRAVCAIQDTGPGIPREERRRIFDKFYQSESSHVEKGNGLGLALVKKIVSVHNGLIEVDEAAEGGCRITVSLPIE